MPKVIIDCDPELTTRLPLLLALSSPELDISGITTVSGNVPADMGARNAKKVFARRTERGFPFITERWFPL